MNQPSLSSLYTAGLLPERAALIALAEQSMQRRKDIPRGVGTQSARVRGRGMDYLETRDYQPGDDVRHIDWRVTARTGALHTKLFAAEAERPVLLVIDFGLSMFFATRVPMKLGAAQMLAARIAGAVVGAGDRIGAVGLLPHSHHELKPIGGRAGLAKFVHAMVDWTEEAYRAHRLDPNRAARADLGSILGRLAKPGARLLLLGDFRHQRVAEIVLRHQRHGTCVATRLVDPLETHTRATGLAVRAVDRRGVASTAQHLAAERQREIRSQDASTVPLRDLVLGP